MGMRTHQDRHSRFGRAVDYEEERDDDADSDSGLKLPNDREREGEDHHGHVHPGTHPASQKQDVSSAEMKVK